jgi:uncharacterized protein (DUF952 family)
MGLASNAARPRNQVVQVSHGRSSVTCAIFSGVPQLTYHLVPRAEWEAADPAQPYVPAAFAQDGFVHCTDGAAELAATANRFFADRPDELLALVLDRTRLTAPVRYEDPGNIYPHVYGPIDRAAVVDVLPMPRDARGAFRAPA